jgi:hypothetical protein
VWAHELDPTWKGGRKRYPLQSGAGSKPGGCLVLTAERSMCFIYLHKAKLSTFLGKYLYSGSDRQNPLDRCLPKLAWQPLPGVLVLGSGDSTWATLSTLNPTCVPTPAIYTAGRCWASTACRLIPSHLRRLVSSWLQTQPSAIQPLQSHYGSRPQRIPPQDRVTSR